MRRKDDSAARLRRLTRIDRTMLWHPFTPMQEYARTKPLIITRGKGSYLYDQHGRRYLDGVSSLWVLVHGHRKAQLDRAMIAQIRRFSHSTLLGLTHEPAIELAERLVAITPAGLTRVFYSDNGSTAVEIALKTAFQYWQQQRSPAARKKQKFLSLINAYHGDTIGAVSVGGIDLFHGIYKPLLFPTFKAASPYCYRCPFSLTHPACGMACVEDMARILRKHHHTIAACIIEPLVQGAAGMIVSPPGYLRAVADLCGRHDVLLIADEVAVGFGRTGKMFACEHERVRPDLMAVAKGITGGTMPLAATLATREIYNAFLGRPEECRTLYHGHTYTGNPVACAAALANLDVFEREQVLRRLQPNITLLRRRLESWRELAHVGDIRQQGFMVGVELVADKTTKTPYLPAARMGHRVILAARDRGVIIRPLGDVIVLMPPLSISERELTALLDAVYDAIRATTETRALQRPGK